MHRIVRLWRLALMAAGLAVVGGCTSERPAPPLAKDGVLDLSQWDFERDGPVELKGEWQFWWQELIAPESFLSPVGAPQPQGLLEVPKPWPGQPHPSVPDESLPSVGYATLKLRVLFPVDTAVGATGIYVRVVNSAYELWALTQGEPLSVLRKGKVSQDPRTEIPERVSEVVLVPVEAAETTLVLHVSNAHLYYGGVPFAPVLGIHEALSRSVLTERLQNTALLGFLLLMGIYNFLLYYLRPKDQTSLWLGIATLAFCVRIVTVNQFPALISEPFMLDFQWLIRCETLAVVLMFASIMKFMAQISLSSMTSKSTNAYILLACSVAAFTIATDAIMFQPYLRGFVFLSSLAMLPVLYCLFRAGIRQPGAARNASLGFLPVILTLLIIIIALIKNPNQVPAATKLTAYAMAFALLVQSYTLTIRFSQALETAEFLTDELGAQVEKQTQTLKENNQELAQAYAELQTTSERELSHAKNLLIQNEKLSQLGQLIASIGHEIANPLMLASLSVDNNREAIDKLEAKTMALFPDTPKAQEVAQIFQHSFDKIRQVNQTTKTATNKIRELSNALRTQSRMEDELTEGIDLNEVSREAVALVSGRIKPHTLTDGLGTIPAVSCFRSRVGQVITNILANAADALHEKTKRTREAGDRSFRGNIHISSTRHASTGYEGVLITIADNGDGVPEHLKHQIFEQFFTTKPAGVGTGLGLAMCVDIVKDHGGNLRVTDDPTLGGARFEIWLPTKVPNQSDGRR